MPRTLKEEVMKRFALCGTGVLIAAFLTLPVPAQDAPTASAEDAYGRELVRLNRSLEEIVALLKRSVEHQELDLLIQRVELAVRRLTSMEEELGRLRNSLEGVEEERLTMEAVREHLEAERDPNAEDADAFEQQMEELDFRLKLLKDQSWKREQRALDLEGKISTLLEDIEALESALDERLGLR